MTKDTNNEPADSDFMHLTKERRIEMNAFARAESLAGRPQIAAPYKKALLEGYYLPPPTPPEELAEALAPPLSGTGSGKVAWRLYAKAVSPDTPDEVIEAMSAREVQKMLYAQGVLLDKGDDTSNDGEASDENE